MMPIATNKTAFAIALSLGVATAGCQTNGDIYSNKSLNSVNQPVVERANFALDLRANSAGLPVTEQRRLVDWFDSLDLGYGDRVYLDDATTSPTVRDDVARLAGRYGLLLSEGTPVTAGHVDPGSVRVVVARSHAYVPNCPNWSARSTDFNDNATDPGFGCAVNGNIAAMISDPEHLLKGAEGSGDTVIMSSNKAISSYREAEPSGAGGLPQVSSQE